MKKDQHKEDETLAVLAMNLVKAREEKNLTQNGLATLSEVSRDKIYYAEINNQGRRLQVEDLVKIAKALNVSTDYLLGVKTETSNNNILANKTSKIISKWDNSTLGEIDKLIETFNDKGFTEDLKNYLMVSYTMNNILDKTLKEIENSTKEKKTLLDIYVKKSAFLMEYIRCLRFNVIDKSTFVKCLVEDHKEELQHIDEQAGQILFYNEDKDHKIDFECIRKAIPILQEYKDYLKYKLDNAIEKSTEDIIKTTEEDQTYFDKIRKFIQDKEQANAEQIIHNNKSNKKQGKAKK